MRIPQPADDHCGTLIQGVSLIAFLASFRRFFRRFLSAAPSNRHVPGAAAAGFEMRSPWPSIRKNVLASPQIPRLAIVLDRHKKLAAIFDMFHIHHI